MPTMDSSALLSPPDISAWQHGNSAAGTPYVHELRSGQPGPEVLLTALVHGNEFSGAIALSELLGLALFPTVGRITVAFCNVAAFARFDADRPHESRYVDQDLNRVWQTEVLNGSAVNSEIERARALLPYVARATHLLDLHSMHEPCAPLLLCGTLARNIAFAQQLQANAQTVIDVGHADGVRMRDYGGFGEASATPLALLLEAGQHWQPSCLAVVRDTVARFLCASGVLAREQLPADWWQANPSTVAALEVTHRVVARSTAVSFAAPFQGLDVISKAGTVIAIDDGEAVLTPYDNCVLVMPSLAQLKPGVTVLRLARQVSA